MTARTAPFRQHVPSACAACPAQTRGTLAPPPRGGKPRHPRRSLTSAPAQAAHRSGILTQGPTAQGNRVKRHGGAFRPAPLTRRRCLLDRRQGLRPWNPFVGSCEGGADCAPCRVRVGPSLTRPRTGVQAPSAWWGPQGHPFQGLCLPKQIGPDLNRGGLAQDGGDFAQAGCKTSSTTRSGGIAGCTMRCPRRIARGQIRGISCP